MAEVFKQDGGVGQATESDALETKLRDKKLDAPFDQNEFNAAFDTQKKHIDDNKDLKPEQKKHLQEQLDKIKVDYQKRFDSLKKIYDLKVSAKLTETSNEIENRQPPSSRSPETPPSVFGTQSLSPCRRPAQ